MKVSLNGLSKSERKMALELKEYIGKSHIRNAGKGTTAKYAQNIRTLSKTLVAMGYQKANHLNTKATTRVMERLEANGMDKSSLASMYTTIGVITRQMEGKENMLSKSSREQFGHDRFRVTSEERFNPQRWTSPEQRQTQQERMERLSPAHASATEMARQFGLRKEESLASREFVVKDSNGRLWTTAGCKNAGEFRELKGPRSAQYAFTDNRKNESFERNYLDRMVVGKEYLYVPGGWAKGGRERLVPVTTPEARAAAIHQQQVIRDNQAFARQLEREGAMMNNGKDRVVAAKVDSVIDPRSTKHEGYDRYGKLLTRAGFDKQESKSLHTDRCEFSIRMRDEYEKDDGKGFDKYDRALALGHCDTRKLSYYES